MTNEVSHFYGDDCDPPHNCPSCGGDVSRCLCGDDEAVRVRMAVADAEEPGWRDAYLDDVRDARG